MYDEIQDGLLRERKEMAKALWLGKRVRYAWDTKRARATGQLKGRGIVEESVATVEKVYISHKQVRYKMSNGDRIPRDQILEWEIAEAAEEAEAA